MPAQHYDSLETRAPEKRERTAGRGNRHLKPTGYLDTPDFLKILLDTTAKTGQGGSSLRRGACLERPVS